MSDQTETPKLSQFAVHFFDKIRFSDTDMLGHVNNSTFGKFFESGRVDVIHDNGVRKTPEGTFFVLAHLGIDFIAEMNWPGDVAIGTNVTKIGRSSVTMHQAIFVDEICVGRANSVIVLMSDKTRRSTALSPELIARLTKLMPPA